MKYLGIDYGKKKMGLAVSEGLTASPLKVVAINSLIDATQKIKNEIEKEGIGKVVVGVPESGEAQKLAQKLIQSLKTHSIEVEEGDETLSSFQARQNMITIGKGRREREKEDAEAASIILQQYLDQQKG